VFHSPVVVARGEPDVELGRDGRDVFVHRHRTPDRNREIAVRTAAGAERHVHVHMPRPRCAACIGQRVQRRGSERTAGLVRRPGKRSWRDQRRWTCPVSRQDTAPANSSVVIAARHRVVGRCDRIAIVSTSIAPVANASQTLASSSLNSDGGGVTSSRGPDQREHILHRDDGSRALALQQAVRTLAPIAIDRPWHDGELSPQVDRVLRRMQCAASRPRLDHHDRATQRRDQSVAMRKHPRRGRAPRLPFRQQ